MPIYEYACQACGKEFEALVRPSTKAACPACGSAALQRRLSTFAVAAGASRSPAASGPGACGSCGDPRGPGSCQLD